MACGVAAAQPPAKKPAIALIDGADAAQWRTWTKDLGWEVIVAQSADSATIDQRVQDLAAAVRAAADGLGVDPARVYLAGRGEAAAAVFYAISRMPDVWAAGVALGGNPQGAVDSGRIFAINFSLSPVLWATTTAEDQALAGKLKSAGVNLEARAASGLTMGAVFEWLASHTREEFPASIDCETNSPVFARCFWIQMSRFDPKERNDVLPSTWVPASSGASLDLGGFGYRRDDPGPGLGVTFLPEKYSGPLKVGDRLVAIDGREIRNAAHYAEIMGKADEEKGAVVMVQRGKDRLRIETRILLPRRDVMVSARAQGSYSPAEKEIQVITRAVTELRVTVPEHWVPGRLFWNGLSLESIEAPGCLALTVEKELLRSAPCGNSPTPK